MGGGGPPPLGAPMVGGNASSHVIFLFDLAPAPPTPSMENSVDLHGAKGAGGPFRS